jgi:inhibitor of cysteine peptidase
MLNDSDFKALVSEKDPNAISKINRILGYDISDYSKFNEISPIMQTIFTTEKDSATMQEMVLNIIKRNTGKIQTTQIVKFDLSNLEIVAKAEVSGNLLNQFAMDEYNDTFRLSTTVDDWRLNNISNTTIRNNENTSTSYSYILDSDLKLLSKLGDLGNGERIYSARYIGEKLYLVTFRQTDPFYVIDLKDPKDIKKVGELKIPGFSSYLHPITENLILGVGQENGKLKLSMFDVSDDTNPVEISKLFLEGWGSDVQYDHHAFLLDKQNKYFVIPSYNGSFLVSYDEKGNLSEQKKLGSEQENFSRSLFINDYLYLVSNQRMFIYDIKNKFEKVNSVKFN